MHGRWFRILLLAFQVVWLGAIVPGHTRRARTLPGGGTKAAAESAHSCCQVGKTDQADPPAEGHQEAPGNTGERLSHCAVCHLVARLMLPPAIDLAPPPLELLAVLRPDRPDRPVLPHAVLTHLARGPPAAV